jgi:hypothetical protein
VILPSLDAGVTTHEGTHAGSGPGLLGFVGMRGEHAAYLGESITYQGLHNNDIPFKLWNESWLKLNQHQLDQRREDHSGRYSSGQTAAHKGMNVVAIYEGRFDPAFAWRNRKRIRLSQNEEKGYGKKHQYDARIVLRRIIDVVARPMPRK